MQGIMQPGNCTHANVPIAWLFLYFVGNVILKKFELRWVILDTATCHGMFAWKGLHKILYQSPKPVGQSCKCDDGTDEGCDGGSIGVREEVDYRDAPASEWWELSCKI